MASRRLFSPFSTWVAGVVSLSLVLIFAGARLDHRPLYALAAVLFSAAVAIEAIVGNRSIWRASGKSSEHALEPREALLWTSLSSALVYGWGAAAMFLSYPVARLPWQHGWQYGLAMAIVAALMGLYLHRLGRGDAQFTSQSAVSLAVRLAALQGIAMATGLAILVVSGKLAAPKVFWKADWAANIVFAAGAATLVILSALIVKTHAVLTVREA